MGQRQAGFRIATNRAGTCYAVVRPPGGQEVWLSLSTSDTERARVLAPQAAGRFWSTFAEAHPTVELPETARELAKANPRPCFVPTRDPSRGPVKRNARVTSRPPKEIDPRRGDEPLPELPRRGIGFTRERTATIAELIRDRYIGDLGRGWRPEPDDRPLRASTIAVAARSTVRAAQLGHWERVEDITTEGLAAWQRSLIHGVQVQGQLKKYTRTYAWGLISHFHGFLRWLKAKGLLHRTLAMPRFRRGYRKRITRLEWTDLLRFCASLPERAPRTGYPLRAMACIVRDTAMRLGNVVEFEARDFHLEDLDHATVEVRVEAEKTGHDVTRPITRETAELVQSWMVERKLQGYDLLFGRWVPVRGTALHRCVSLVKHETWARHLRKVGCLPDLQGRHGTHAMRKAVLGRWADIAHTAERHGGGFRLFLQASGLGDLQSAANYMMPRGPEVIRRGFLPKSQEPEAPWRRLELTLTRQGDRLDVELRGGTGDEPREPARLSLHQLDQLASDLCEVVDKALGRAVPGDDLPW